MRPHHLLSPVVLLCTLLAAQGAMSASNEADGKARNVTTVLEKCVGSRISSNGTAQLTVCLLPAQNATDASDEFSEVHVRIVNTGTSGACDVRVAVEGREYATRIWPDWLNESLSTVKAASGREALVALYPMPIEPKEMLHAGMELPRTHNPWQVGLPAARDDKRTTASGAINPMVPGPGPITIVSLSPCDAHAGDEAQASDVQEDGKAGGKDSVTGTPLGETAIPATPATPPANVNTPNANANTQAAPANASAANATANASGTKGPAVDKGPRPHMKCVNKTATPSKDDGGEPPIQVYWCVPKKPYVWVEPRGKRRFVKVQGEVINPDTNHGSACDMRFEMEGVEAAPINTWPEWFPVSAEPLEPGVSVSVGANVRKKKGFPIITLAGFKRCPEDPGAE